MHKSIGKWKILSWNFAHVITSARLPAMQILVSIGTVAACVDTTPRSNRWTDFQALWLKGRVSAQKWSYSGLERWVTKFGGNIPPNSPKIGVNRQFQAKTAKYKNHNISETINRIKTKFEDQAETNNCTSCVHIKSNMAAGGHLEKMDMTL